MKPAGTSSTSLKPSSINISKKAMQFPLRIHRNASFRFEPLCLGNAENLSSPCHRQSKCNWYRRQRWFGEEHTELEQRVGICNERFTGRSLNYEIFENGTSGGMVTALLHWVIEKFISALCVNRAMEAAEELPWQTRIAWLSRDDNGA
jgi:hypothetical protein